MEYIKSLSIVQKIALIAAPVLALNFELFGAPSWALFRAEGWDRFLAEIISYFSAIAACVAIFFLFPAKKKES